MQMAATKKLKSDDMVVFNQLYQSCVYAKINSYSEIASCFINLNMEILIPFFEIAAFKTSKPSKQQSYQLLPIQAM